MEHLIKYVNMYTIECNSPKTMKVLFNKKSLDNGFIKDLNTVKLVSTRAKPTEIDINLIFFSRKQDLMKP